MVKGEIPRLKMTIGTLDADNDVIWSKEEAEDPAAVPSALQKALKLYERFAAEGEGVGALVGVALCRQQQERGVRKLGGRTKLWKH